MALAAVPTSEATPSVEQASGILPETGPTMYACARGHLFVKKSEDPACNRIVKLPRHVGDLVRTTGSLWRGLRGGIWAELDASAATGASRGSGLFGWVLVESPTREFGVPGAALIDAKQAQYMYEVRVLLLSEEESTGLVFEALFDGDFTIGEIKRVLCETTGLTEHLCCLAKDPPGLAPNGIRLGADFMPELKDDRLLGNCGFQDGQALLFLIYVGDLPRKLEVKPH
eukprot:CAMPEP_0206479880 /NCGR_PEP_ID=MMETSP0324_2-20121206/36928_1 /ASSEMBLY_ACC=CAM_ASM_000836 /TAXON_ID=2866 /ORGANISM="Crypthecodinium cohnii, Strain Seligo" /LENGTH=227 /DNA_ID=CAMNT_0053956493 /DNA_START=68 /DNA_END=748 /DNA_ORIENTATION=-